MIHRLSSIANLAIVGMSVVIPGGGDINEFGRHMYRGLPLTDQFNDRKSLESAVNQAIKRVCGDAHLAIERLPIISLSTPLPASINNNAHGSQVREVLGIVPGLCAASDILESSGEDAVMLIEGQE